MPLFFFLTQCLRRGSAPQSFATQNTCLVFARSLRSHTRCVRSVERACFRQCLLTLFVFRHSVSRLKCHRKKSFLFAVFELFLLMKYRNKLPPRLPALTAMTRLCRLLLVIPNCPLSIRSQRLAHTRITSDTCPNNASTDLVARKSFCSRRTFCITAESRSQEKPYRPNLRTGFSCLFNAYRHHQHHTLGEREGQGFNSFV